MRRTTVIIIGAGQAGLAMSHCLSARGVEHVVLERGQIGERWRSSSWHSLRLLTPNWMSRLPGLQYRGDDPDGFMAIPEVVALLEGYAYTSRAPVHPETAVRRVEPWESGFRVVTDRGEWLGRAVVVATGHCDLPAVPEMSRQLAPSIHQLVPSKYRHPDQLPPGGVLVVGASATGVQLADELRAAGREVTLAVGRHTRLPRRYRGRDILWWLDRLGILSQSVDEVHDAAISRGQPSLQLVGRRDSASLDLAVLHARGVRLAGRLSAIEGQQVRFDEDLIATSAAADLKLAAILQRIDQFLADANEPAPAAEPFVPTWPLAQHAIAEADLAADGIATVIWATGYRRAYPWLQVPVLDARGEIRHRHGITPHPGLYVLGMNFQRRRNSSFIDGVGADAAFLADHLVEWLAADHAALPARTEGTTRTSAGRPGRSVFDVIVVGARCAGAATAMLLARAGARVLVVDRGAYGTDTLSTHALMRGAVLQLHRWGVLPAVIEANTPPVRSTLFGYPTHEVRVAIDERFGVDSLYAPRRLVLDRLLVDAAVRSGVEFSYHASVEDVVRNAAGRVSGVRLGGDQALRTIEAPLVVGADGLRSTVAARVGAAPLLSGSHAAGSLYSYWDHLKTDGYEWHFRPGVSVGAIPTNHGAACVFVSLPAAQFRDEVRGDAAGAYERLLPTGSADLAARLAQARRVEPVRGFAGTPGFIRQSAGPGWALVGDAAYFKDPITAHGITDALRDAELLARAILRGTDAALADYVSTRDALSLELFRVTDRIASFAWSMEELEGLHRAFSKAMSHEVRVLAGLEPLELAAAAAPTLA